jgi:hypothetical protein
VAFIHKHNFLPLLSPVLVLLGKFQPLQLHPVFLVRRGYWAIFLEGRPSLALQMCWLDGPNLHVF